MKDRPGDNELLKSLKTHTQILDGLRGHNIKEQLPWLHEVLK
jgi:hypothetical protein